MSLVIKYATIFWSILLAWAPLSRAQQEGAGILGRWANEDRTRVLEFVAAGNGYEAIIRKAPDQDKLGKKQITGIIYQDGSYKGSLHLPKRGKVMPCTLFINEEGQLLLTAKSGFLSQKQVWSKLE